MVDIQSDIVRGQVLKNEGLARYTSWRTGGPADYVFLPADLSDLSNFLKQVPKDIPITWLGLGSNTLIRDGGLEGIVIITQGCLNQLQVLPNGLIRAEAGVASTQLARFSARQGSTGLEFLAGIPGTVGGALAMNAGCYGGETWCCTEAVEIINRYGEMITRPKFEFTTRYRYVERVPDEWFIAGHFKLQTADSKYCLHVIRELIKKRNDSQPTGTPNCGSVFRNPPNHFAGRLIESCGLKGMRIGGAVVSEKHANFIINEDTAKSNDIENLILHIQEIVSQKSGIELMPEVCILGRK